METLKVLSEFALTGFIVSSLVQWTKDMFEKTTHKVLYAVGVSIVLGGIAYGFDFIPADWLTVIVGVWASANTVYLLIFQPKNK